MSLVASLKCCTYFHWHFNLKQLVLVEIIFESQGVNVRVGVCAFCGYLAVTVFLVRVLVYCIVMVYGWLLCSGLCSVCLKDYLSQFLYTLFKIICPVFFFTCYCKIICPAFLFALCKIICPVFLSALCKIICPIFLSALCKIICPIFLGLHFVRLSVLGFLSALGKIICSVFLSALGKIICPISVIIK